MKSASIFNDIIINKLKNPSPLEFLLDIGQLKYSFAGGLPANETFEVEQLAEVGRKTILDQPDKLQYGVTRGDADLIRAIIELTSKNEGVKISEENIITTIGSQYGIFLLSFVFLSKSSKVILANPSYIGALEAFELFQPRYLTADMESDGISTEQIETLLRENPDVKFIYIVPEFQNPTGITVSLAKRKKIIELAKQYQVLIIEDSPYRDIRYLGAHLPSIFSLYPEGTVCLKTMSKIAAPGFRVAWVVGPEPILRALKIVKSASIMFSSSVCEATVCNYLKLKQAGSLVNENSLNHYLQKREQIIGALEKHMPVGVTWTKPEGGFVLWLNLPGHIDSEQLLVKCSEEYKVSFIPGKFFYPGSVEKNTLRLSFGVIDKGLIDEGINRLANSIRKY